MVDHGGQCHSLEPDHVVLKSATIRRLDIDKYEPHHGLS
jgi:hypothetical protein